jgi:UPF0755 protein
MSSEQSHQLRSDRGGLSAEPSGPGTRMEPGPWTAPGAGMEPGPWTEPGAATEPGPWMAPGPWTAPGAGMEPGPWTEPGHHGVAEPNGARWNADSPGGSRYSGGLAADPYQGGIPHDPQDPYPGVPASDSGPLRPASHPDAPAMPGQAAGQGFQDGYGDTDDEGEGYGWEPEFEDDASVPMGPGGRKSRRGDGRPRRHGRRFSAPLIAVLVLALFLSGGGIVGYHFLRQYVIPPDYSGPGYGSVIVQVKQNQTATDVARTLYSLGVVASTRAFVKAAEQSSRPTALEPGFYRMHRHMKAVLAFDLLLNPGARIQLDVTIPEGLRASQIVTTLGAKSGISTADYRAALANPAALGLPAYAKNKPEGYLFPATYPVEPQMTATDVLRAMVRQFDAEAARINLVAVAQSVNLTPAEAIIVASLVQAEGGRVSDFPKIARVIYNRLAGNMPLQLDSTVMYALHSYGILATNQQLQVNSPYNTYQHPGLPPGPIDSPGDAAIHAALHPAKGTWLYFVTVNPKTGVTEFTSSYATFVQLRAELEQNLAHGG